MDLTAEDVIFSGLMSIQAPLERELQREVLPPLNRCLWTVVRKAHLARQSPLAEMFQCSWTQDGEFHLDASGGLSRLMGEGILAAHVDLSWYGIIRSPLLQLVNWSQTLIRMAWACEGNQTAQIAADIAASRPKDELFADAMNNSEPTYWKS